MKISINSQFLMGPYGGGMQFANFMRRYLSGQGVVVVNDLHDDDIDIILHVSPFPFLTPKASAYSFLDAYAYKLTHQRTIIIERINECDERKGTNYVNRLLIQTAKCSDFVVYIASWLAKLMEDQGLPNTIPSKTIRNGADEHIFNAIGKISWDGTEKLRLVTHHWSDNPKKGHGVYQELDKLLDDPSFAAQFEFTYIGRIPRERSYRNVKVIAPLTGTALASELQQHHVYITASINEPGGMHHIEGALCGLPLLYINSGALPEYCAGFGIEFSLENLKEKLYEMCRDYHQYRDALQSYPNTATHMGAQYMELMRKLVDDRRIRKFPYGKIKAIWFRIYARILSAWWLLKHKFHRI